MGDSVEALLRELERQTRHDPHDPRVRVGVAGRAGGRCEYCLLKTGGQFQLDHIIPPRLWSRYVVGAIAGVAPKPGRRGPDHLDNYAWSCPFCNGDKKQQLRFPDSDRGSRLFDPRYDAWADHFAFVNDYIIIHGFTDIGKATEQALNLNDSRPNNRVGLRHVAIKIGDYPPDWARELLITI